MKSKKSVRRTLVASCVGVALLLAGGEFAIRMAGVTDFPIYEADDHIGYILAPSQQGAFLNKNHWSYNEKSQGAGPWRPNGRTDLLLLGDSIVLGGNPLDQADRLGSRLQSLLPHWQVWPVSAGSWSVANEIAYLHRFPEVVEAVTAIIWIFNTGDLEQASVWKSELTHPRNHPRSALWYVFEKYFLLPRFGSVASEGATSSKPQIRPEAMVALQNELRQLKSQKPSRSILLVLYPARGELGDSKPEVRAFYQEFRSTLSALALANGDPFLEVLDDPRWNAGLYRDGIHPSAEGNRILAEIIADKLRTQGLP